MMKGFAIVQVRRGVRRVFGVHRDEAEARYWLRRFRRPLSDFRLAGETRQEFRKRVTKCWRGWELVCLDRRVQ